MARVVLPGKWTGALMRQHGSLRTYQWLWIAVCTASVLLAAAPRILSQPVVYTTAATVQVQPGRGYFNIIKSGDSDPEFTAVRDIALKLVALKTIGDQPLYPALGSPTRSVSFAPQPDGRVLVSATSADAAQAQRLADDAAEAMARSIRAAGGREVYRQLAGWEQNAAYDAQPPRTPFQRTLRDMYRTNAFPLNRAIDLLPNVITVDQLQPDDVRDLICALEVRSVELSQIDLAALKPRRDAAAGDERKQLDNDVARLELGLQSIRAALDFLYTPQNLPGNIGGPFKPDAVSAVYRSAVAAPASEVDRRFAPLLALAALVGLVLGIGGVAVDRSTNLMQKVRELWSYRELIRNLVLRDLRVRYKGSALGYLWTQIAPLLLMLIFVFVFSVLMPNNIAIFPVFLLVGLLPWNFCAEAINSGTRSILDNANLIKKVFFPREVLPLVSVLSSLLNYLLSLPMMLLVIAIAQWLSIGRLNFAWTFVYLPVVVVIETILMFGIALFLSALAVFFRDMVHLIGILIQFWFFLTPVVYSLDSIHIPERVGRLIRWFNPMASIIEFYREILYGTAVQYPNVPTPGLPALDSVLRVLLTAIVVLAFGYWFFQRQSGRFGEEI